MRDVGIGCPSAASAAGSAVVLIRGVSVGLAVMGEGHGSVEGRDGREASAAAAHVAAAAHGQAAAAAATETVAILPRQLTCA